MAVQSVPRLEGHFSLDYGISKELGVFVKMPVLVDECGYPAIGESCDWHAVFYSAIAD